MRIAILGTRGIPNRYGGFEQFAEYLAVGLKDKGHEVVVYLPSGHPFQEKNYKGVALRKKWCPESQIGVLAHFIYDYISLKDAVKEGWDIILECGYGTVSIFYPICSPKDSIIVTNMDGLEWSRDKWSVPVRKMTRWFESLAVRHSGSLVSDNVGIQDYICARYGTESTYLPYGADVVDVTSPDFLSNYHLAEFGYYLIIARLEPENNIEMILDGYASSGSETPFLVIGNHQTKYGTFLKKRYRHNRNVQFVGGVYDKAGLDALRFYAKMYFHGHSVGGTNPSLLEAMACGAYIAAHNNCFNLAVAGENAFYFSNSGDVARLILETREHDRGGFIEGNRQRIESEFSWKSVVDGYEALFQDLLEKRARLGK